MAESDDGPDRIYGVMVVGMLELFRYGFSRFIILLAEPSKLTAFDSLFISQHLVMDAAQSPALFFSVSVGYSNGLFFIS